MLRQPPLPFWPALGKLLLRWYTGLASFGWTNLTVHWVWYWLFAILGLWGAVGLLLAGGRAVLTRRMRLVHWLLLVWPLAFVVSLARWVEVNTAADQWRLLFPAYPALALLLTIGLWHLLRRSWQPVLALAAGLLALNVGALMLSILPAYAGPSSYSGRIAHPLDIRFGSSLRLVGYSTPRPVGARPESPVEIDLFWQALGPIRRDYAVDAATVDATGRLTWKELSMPDQGRSPMTAWTPGRVMLDRHVIRARPEMVGVQTLLLSVLDPAPPGLHLQAVDGAGRRLANDGASLARFMVLPSRVPEPLTKDAITFQDHLALTGHSVEQIGDQLRVTLDWKATGSIGKDYTVFVHLLAPNGRQVAQHDGQPSGGAFPTSLLPVNAAVPDVHVLDIPSLPPGDYRLEIGLYDLATGARLVTDRGGSSVTLPAHLAKLPPVPLG